MATATATPQPSTEVKNLIAETQGKIGNDAIELLFLELEAKKADAKRLYAECDEIESRLINAIGDGQVSTGDGRRIVVTDNFWDAKTNQPKNVSWKPCGVKRFEVTANRVS